MTGPPLQANAFFFRGRVVLSAADVPPSGFLPKIPPPFFLTQDAVFLPFFRPFEPRTPFFPLQTEGIFFFSFFTRPGPTFV